MNLKQLIEYLEKKDTDIIVPVGFDKPRLCIGDYTCLAFEPAGDVTVGAMLQCARSAVGTTYRNWLDDEYQMHGGTEVYLAMSGCVGENIGGVLLDYSEDPFNSGSGYGVSPFITYQYSERLFCRLQYHRTWNDPLYGGMDSNEISLQLNISLGRHRPHLY